MNGITMPRYLANAAMIMTLTMHVEPAGCRLDMLKVYIGVELTG